VDISFPEIEKFDHLPPPRKEGASAFVSIPPLWSSERTTAITTGRMSAKTNGASVVWPASRGGDSSSGG
jgi:hypothetical protein